MNTRWINIKHVDKRTVSGFCQAMDPEMKQEFWNLIIKDIEIMNEKILPRYEIDMQHKAFLGKFHHYFVKKVIYNIKKEDFKCKYISTLASIFPFEVSRDVDKINLDIFGILDSDFENEIGQFVQNHFSDTEEVYDLITLFLRNIHDFKTTETEVGPYGEASNENHVENLDNMNIAKKRRNVLKLTNEGVERYQSSYALTRRALEHFCPSQTESINFDKFDESYFRDLPKNNLKELYSLLELEFYKTEPIQYRKLFKKYLFFFLHALRSEEKPVFFIDDLLFECLLSWHDFQISRQDPVYLKSHMANLTCVYQRRRRNHAELNDFLVSDNSLREIQHFFKNGIRGIETTEMQYTTEGAMLDNRIFACTNHEAFDVCFSHTVKNDKRDFLKIIIKAAFSKKYFNRLCIYNVYLGVKTWIYNPSCKNEILNFVRKYNKHKPESLPPEYFITHNFEDCFTEL